MLFSNPSASENGLIPVISAIIAAAFDRRLGLRLAIACGAVLEFAGIALGIAGPFALKLLVDGLTTKSFTMLQVLLTAAIFVAAWSLAAVLSIWRLVYSGRVIDRLTQELAHRTVRKQLLSLARSREGDSGHLLGLMERLPYALTVVVDGLLWRIIALILQVLGSLSILAQTVPVSYVALLGLVLGCYAIATWWGAINLEKLATTVNQVAAAASADLGDVLRNAKRVVFNGAIDVEAGLVARRFEHKVRANLRMISSLLCSAFAQFGILTVGLLVLFVLAATDVLQGRLSVSAFVLLQAYAFRLVIPLSGFGYIASQAAPAVATIREVLDLAAWVQPPRQAKITIEGPAELRIDHLRFRYKDGGAGLNDISGRIEPGSFVAIIGPNGSGKSTLAQLMAGLLKPVEGRVTVAGYDLATIPDEDHHNLVLYVPQVVTLFNRSLLENALYPPTHQTEAGLDALLALWNFDPSRQTVDLNRVAGEGGERLSGGQLQKLELARIAGVNVPVLILDESTSALDPASEAAVIGTLRQNMNCRTTLILVTHRKGLAEAADRILFIKDGKLVREGTHCQLMADSWAYREHWIRETRRR